jgi:holo-[acyl-carrier protein] synthase
MFSDKFLNRIFTEQEQIRSDGKYHMAASYAKRFAAKEAFVKALGVGMSDGIHWPEVEVVNLDTGQPTIHVHGRAAELLASKCPHGNRVIIHLSLSDTKDLAQAFVVIEALPDANSA